MRYRFVVSAGDRLSAVQNGNSVMMEKRTKENATESGQSLVEVALVLPILIIMIIGIVELSNTLNTQNKVTTASRVAAGFGAANYDRENFESVTAVDMGQVAINTITETLTIDPDRWDIWAIRGQTDSLGSDFSVFTYTHYSELGNYQVISEAEWEGMVTDVKQDIIDALKSVCGGGGDCDNAADLEIVASVPFYRPEPILGLPLLEWLNLDRQRGLTVMRVDKPPEVAGCPLLPIAVRLDQWSMYPSDWYDPDTETLAPKLANAWPEHDVQPFPPFDDKVWEYPNCGDVDCAFPKNKPEKPMIPRYENDFSPFPSAKFSASKSDFSLNVPGVPISPTEGLSFPKHHIFWAREQGDSAGNFGWLSWNGANNVTKLNHSLDLPAGDFLNPFDFPKLDGNISNEGGYVGSRADVGELVNIDNYPAETSGDGDGWLEIGEWVEGAPGNMDATGTQGLQHWIFDPDLDTPTKSRPVVLILFDAANDDSGSNTNYRVAGFVSARMLGYSFGSTNTCKADDLDCVFYGGKWIVFELLGPADRCYNPEDS